MTSITHQLRNRELGLPGAREQFIRPEVMTGYYLSKDMYTARKVSLPLGSRAFFGRNVMAVLHTKPEERKIISVALYSLFTGMLWEREITRFDEKLIYANNSVPTCYPDESGSVRINVIPGTTDPKISNRSSVYIIISADGSHQEHFKDCSWTSLSLIGNRVLGCRDSAPMIEERCYNKGPSETPVTVYTTVAASQQLSFPYAPSASYSTAHDEKWWARITSNHDLNPPQMDANEEFMDIAQAPTDESSDLSRAQTIDLSAPSQALSNIASPSPDSSTIEYFDHTATSFDKRITFSFPYKPNTYYEAHHVANDLLFYYTADVVDIHQDRNPRIGIFDLAHNKIVGEFKTGRLKGDRIIGVIKHVVANDFFVAWWETPYTLSSKGQVKYIRLSDAFQYHTHPKEVDNAVKQIIDDENTHSFNLRATGLTHEDFILLQLDLEDSRVSFQPSGACS